MGVGRPDGGEPDVNKGERGDSGVKMLETAKKLRGGGGGSLAPPYLICSSLEWIWAKFYDWETLAGEIHYW